MTSILAVLLMAPISTFGQGLGRIGGTVADHSGALVPVKITATEVGANLARSALSDERGLVVIPSLRPAITERSSGMGIGGGSASCLGHVCV